MLDSIKMINEEGTSTPYSLVGGACSVISTTNNGNGSYTLNLPDGTELEESKIYYVEFSPTTASATLNLKLNGFNIYSRYYDTSKILKGTYMYYANEWKHRFGTHSFILPLTYGSSGRFYVIGEHLIANFYNKSSTSYTNQAGVSVTEYNVQEYRIFADGRAEYICSLYTQANNEVILNASYGNNILYFLKFKENPHVEISCWGKDSSNIPRMVLTGKVYTDLFRYKVLDNDVYGYSIKAEGIVF